MSWPFGSKDRADTATVYDGVAEGTPTSDDAASAASNITARNQTAYRTAGGVTQAQLLLRQPGPSSLRFPGLRSDISRGGAVRAVAGQIAHRYGIALAAADNLTSGNVATSADLSFEIVFRVDMSIWIQGQDSIAYHGSADGGGTRDWQVGITAATGTPFVTFDRYVSSAQTATCTTTVHNGQILSLLFTINGSAATAVVYINGLSEATASSIGAHASNSHPLVITAATGLEVLRVTWWNAELSAAESLARYDRTRTAVEASLVQGFNFDDGSDNPANIVSGGVAMTNTGGTWVQRVNTCPRPSGEYEDTGAMTIHGPPVERRALDTRQTRAFVQCAATATESPFIAISFWMRAEENSDTAANQTVVWFGPTNGDRDFAIYIKDTTGALTFNPNRDSSVNLTGEVVTDDAFRFVYAEIDGAFSDDALLRVWSAAGVESAQVGPTAAASYSASAVARLSIGGVGAASEQMCGMIWGDVVLWKRRPTDAELQAQREGYANPVGDPEMAMLHRLGDNITTSTDHGAEGLDITVSSAVFTKTKHPMAAIAKGHGSRHDGLWGHRLAAATAYDEALLLIFDPETPAGQIEIEGCYLFEAEDIGSSSTAGTPEGADPTPAAVVPAPTITGYPSGPADGRKRVTLPLIKCTAAEAEIFRAAFVDQRLVAVLPDSTVDSGLSWSRVVIGTIASFSAPVIPESAGPTYYRVAVTVEGLPGWRR